MTRFEYEPQNVCSVKLSFALEGDVIHDVAFTGGCSGNLQAVSKLVEGKKAQEVIGLLKGNACGVKSTSCADQLAQALEKALSAEK